MKARKKPIVVEAWQYFPANDLTDTNAVPDWLVKAVVDAVVRPDPLTDKLIIRTDTHGEELCNPSDWIMRGVEGELYPCKDSVFQATYEIVE